MLLLIHIPLICIAPFYLVHDMGIASWPIPSPHSPTIKSLGMMLTRVLKLQTFLFVKPKSWYGGSNVLSLCPWAPGS